MRPEIAFLAVVAAAALLSMIAYRVSHGRGGVGSQHTERRGSFALGAWVRNWFYWILRPLELPIRSLRIPPEVFNALGVIVALASMAAYARGALPLGGYLLLASGLADVLDGIAARVRGVVSRYGAFLDSTLDRFAESAVFVGLAVAFRTPVAIVLVFVAFAGSMLVSYARARGEGLGVQCKVGIAQRAERMLLLGLASVLDPTVSEAAGRGPGALLLPVIALIAAAATGTAVYRTVWISRALRAEDTD